MKGSKKFPNKDSEKTRHAVSEDYAKAVKSHGSGCCGGPVPKGVVARIAGYTNDDFATLPIEAVVNSFGCGNPLAFSEVQPGQVVLDLGSGAGIDLLLAGKKVGATGKVIGVDMTDEMIAKAEENIAAAGLTNVEVRKGIIEELPVDDASVDWVISNCVINLSPEKHRVFAEIARVLKPGGTMLVSDIVAEELPAEITENRHLYSSCLAGAISEDAYVSGLREAGLTEVEVVDRLVYDEAQLEMFIGSELQVEGDSCCCATKAVDPSLARRWAERLAGKVASIKVRAKAKASVTND
jgi:SAM-dependent methyltransferase